MTALRKPLMSVDEFMVWADRQPEQWELFNGVPAAMSPGLALAGRDSIKVAGRLRVCADS
jgi:hypothetical protein